MENSSLENYYPVLKPAPHAPALCTLITNY